MDASKDAKATPFDVLHQHHLRHVPIGHTLAQSHHAGRLAHAATSALTSGEVPRSRHALLSHRATAHPAQRMCARLRHP
eukprot:49288-Lingulodinium_polyedra.AAC.1